MARCGIIELSIGDGIMEAKERMQLREENSSRLASSDELSKLLCVSALSGVYNYNVSFEAGLSFYKKSSGKYPITLGEKGISLLLNDKETCKMLDICEKVKTLYSLQVGRKVKKDFYEHFKQMHSLVVVVKYLKESPQNEKEIKDLII